MTDSDSTAFSPGPNATPRVSPGELLGRALESKPANGNPHAWQPPSPEALQAHLRGYHVQQFIARGGMGAVYRGVQTSLGRQVAIKILPPELRESDPQYAARFKQEARAMAQLNHPSIVSVYDFGEMPDGTFYFIMEFIDGTDVGQMVTKQGRLSSAHAMAITAHVCDALQYAHERGIVHRDIKPANIMVGFDGRVKVADFGLAKSTRQMDTGLTQSGYVMGTPHFVAPEAMLMGISVDHRADIYAVGVMLYQMLTGKVPQGLFEMPSLQVPGLDPRYDAIVSSAMRENRDQRYQHIIDMRHALDAIVTQPVQKSEIAKQTVPISEVAHRPPQQQHATERASRPQPPRRKTSQRRSAVLLGIAVVLLAGLCAWWQLEHELPDPKTAAKGTDPATEQRQLTRPDDSKTEPAKLQSAPIPAVKPISPPPPKPVQPVMPQVEPPRLESKKPSSELTQMPSSPVIERLALLEAQFHQASDLNSAKLVEAQIAALGKSYLANGFPRALTEAQKRNDQQEMIALNKERDAYINRAVVPPADEVGIHPTVKQLRATYHKARTNIETASSQKSVSPEMYEPYLIELRKLLSEAGKADRQKVMERYQEIANKAGFHTLATAAMTPQYKRMCSGSERQALITQGGGNSASEKAITRAFDYLKAKQNPDGSWGTNYTCLNTSLALMAFHGRCETADSPFYGDTIIKALMYLIETSRKNPEGIFSADLTSAEAIVEHGVSTYAMGEYYTATRYGAKSLPGLREVFERGVQTIIKHQLPSGCWTGDQGSVFGTSNGVGLLATIWQTMALEAATRSSLRFDGLQDAKNKVANFLITYQTPEGGFGVVNGPPRTNPAFVSGAFIHLLGMLKSPAISSVSKGRQYSADLMHKVPPRWEQADLQSWFFYTEALRNDPKFWPDWQRAFEPLLLSHQTPAGSWSISMGFPIGNSSDSTALAVLILESYYRNVRLEGDVKSNR